MTISLQNTLPKVVPNSPSVTGTYISDGPPPVLSPQVFSQFIGASWFDNQTNVLYRFFGASNGSWAAFPSTVQPGNPIPWLTVSQTQSTQVNTGYLIVSGSTPVVLTLPLVSAVGSVIYFKSAVYSLGAAPVSPGFTIAQNAGQQILQSNTAGSTLGTSGSFVANSMGLSIDLICVVANTIWNVLTVDNGSFTFN